MLLPSVWSISSSCYNLLITILTWPELIVGLKPNQQSNLQPIDTWCNIYFWTTDPIYSPLQAHHTLSHKPIPDFTKSSLTHLICPIHFDTYYLSNSLWHILFENVQYTTTHRKHVCGGPRVAGIYIGPIPSPIMYPLIFRIYLIYLGPSIVLCIFCSENWNISLFISLFISSPWTQVWILLWKSRDRPSWSNRFMPVFSMKKSVSTP